MNRIAEQSHCIQRRRSLGIGLALVAGAAAAGAFAMAATSPLANADTADLPGFVEQVGPTSNTVITGIAPLFSGDAFDVNGQYTDVFGDTINTADFPTVGHEDAYSFPGTGTPTLQAVGFIDDNGDEVTTPTGTVLGSTFGVTASTSGFFSDYEDTSFVPTGQTLGSVDNINEVMVYDPSLTFPLTDSAVVFGIQYLDLPDAATPVDEINILGSGGEILLSIPVTGDLASLF